MILSIFLAPATRRTTPTLQASGDPPGNTLSPSVAGGSLGGHGEKDGGTGEVGEENMEAEGDRLEGKIDRERKLERD